MFFVFAPTSLNVTPDFDSEWLSGKVALVSFWLFIDLELFEVY
jgi:hypothetical protein